MRKELIKRIRLVCGLDQVELAELIGKTQSYIAKVEAGSIPLPSEVELQIKRAFHSVGLTESDFVLINELGKVRANETDNR